MIIRRTDQAVIHLDVNGLSLPAIPWDKMEGGEKKSEGLAVFPGGSPDQVELGGVAKREPLKLSVKWSDAFIQQWKALDSVAGNEEKGACTAGYSITDANYIPTGQGATYTGVVLEVDRPNYESGKAEEALLTVVVGLNGPIA